MVFRLKILFTTLLFCSISFSQINIYHRPDNIKKFGDYLFCERDYLRAVFEYENYIKSNNNDTVLFKMGLSYQKLEEYDKSAEIFKSLFNNISFAGSSKQEYYNSLFRKVNYNDFRNIYLAAGEEIRQIESAKKLFLYSFFFTEDELPAENEYSKVFSKDDEVNKFYIMKSKPLHKSELTAAILSAILPGAGKIYTEQYGDGITAFIATGLLSYLSYTNFNAEHNFRGWLFGGLAAVFYAGNIYGSAASAQIYNAGIKFNFENDLKAYLNQNNYFMPDYNFCR